MRSFKKELNSKLAALDIASVSADDYFGVRIESFDVISIIVVSPDKEKVFAIEEIVNQYVTDFIVNTYDVNKVECILDSCLANVVTKEGRHDLDTPILDESNDVLVIDEGIDFVTMSNLIIILSAVALYMAVVFLITITNYKETRE